MEEVYVYWKQSCMRCIINVKICRTNWSVHFKIGTEQTRLFINFNYLFFYQSEEKSKLNLYRNVETEFNVKLVLA